MSEVPGLDGVIDRLCPDPFRQQTPRPLLAVHRIYPIAIDRRSSFKEDFLIFPQKPTPLGTQARSTVLLVDEDMP